MLVNCRELSTGAAQGKRDFTECAKSRQSIAREPILLKSFARHAREGIMRRRGLDLRTAIHSLMGGEAALREPQ